MKKFQILLLALTILGCEKSISLLSEIPIGGNFSFPDKLGNQRDLSAYPSKTLVVFFGYTQCPDFCPNVLTKLKKIIATLPQEERPKVVFVSLDPERDSPEVAQKFASFYSPDAEGLSFNLEATEKIMKQYAVYSEKNRDGITIDHSTYIYVLDKDRKTRALIKSNDSEDQIVSVLKEAARL